MFDFDQQVQSWRQATAPFGAVWFNGGHTNRHASAAVGISIGGFLIAQILLVSLSLLPPGLLRLGRSA